MGAGDVPANLHFQCTCQAGKMACSHLLCLYPLSDTVLAETDNYLSHTLCVLKIGFPLGDSGGDEGRTCGEQYGERQRRGREGFFLSHQSIGSRVTDANDRVSGWLWQRQRPQAAAGSGPCRDSIQILLSATWGWFNTPVPGQWKRLIIQPVSPSSPSAPAHYPELLRCAVWAPADTARRRDQRQ